MDIINQGDFAISNKDKRTIFTFRIPSQEVINFTKKGIPKLRNVYIRPTDKIGRNSPCPCGSGKKYKRCHGK